MGSVALVSGCLLGIPCKYSGKSASHELEEDVIKRLDLIVVPICPEQLGGLPTPRRLQKSEAAMAAMCSMGWPGW